MDPLDNQRRVDYNPYNLLERLVIYETLHETIPMLSMLTRVFVKTRAFCQHI